MQFGFRQSSRRMVEDGEDFLLDGELDGVWKLEAGAGENFDAVVCPRIVRGGDDDSSGELLRPSEISDAGSSDYAGRLHRASGGDEALRETVGDPSARLARVLADDDAGLRRGANEAVAESETDGVNSGGCKRRFSGDTANAIGAKKLASRISHERNLWSGLRDRKSTRLN